MSGQQMKNPEMNSVHSVKILLCYLLEKLKHPITETELREVTEKSGIINYFLLSDALEELIENDSVQVRNEGERVFSLTEKGRLGAEYFNTAIPLVFRRQLLKTAFTFFLERKNEELSEVSVYAQKGKKGCSVSFKLTDGKNGLIDMLFFAPDADQAELIAEKIRSNPTGAYRKILTCLLDNEPEEADVERFL